MIEEFYKEYIEGYGRHLKDTDPRGVLEFLGQTIEKLEALESTEDSRAFLVQVLMSRSRILLEAEENRRALEDAHRAYDLNSTLKFELIDVCTLGAFYSALLANANRILESARVLAKLMLACVEDKSGGILGWTLSEFCSAVRDEHTALLVIRKAALLMSDG